MFPLWYCSICQSCEEQLSLDFPPVALPTFNGTIRASDYLHIIFFCFSSLHENTCKAHYLQEHAGSPQLITHHCMAWLTSNAARSSSNSPKHLMMCCFPPLRRRQHLGLTQDFDAKMSSDPATWLSTLYLLRYLTSTRLANSVWLELTVQDFHLLNELPLAGHTIIPWGYIIESLVLV